MQKLSLTLSSIIVLSASLFGATLSTTPTDSSLIVYNSNIALVHEKRKLSLDKSDSQIIYRDVASSIKTDSVNVKLPKSTTLLSQQYRFDRLTMTKLLDAHIGKKIRVGKKTFTLLSYDSTQAIVKNSKGLILSILSKDIVFKTIPSSLITKPSLVWNIKTKKSLETTMEIDYLIEKISWKSDYILNIRKNRADLTGWITINNRSGKAYHNTKLQVLAGDVNRVYRPKNIARYAKTATMLYDSQSVTQRAYEGYHFYTIPFRVTLANNEKTQLKFIEKESIPIKRKYSVTTNNPLYLHGKTEHSVTQSIEIKELNFPLPKGVVRSYSKLKKQNVFLGESSINHTPKKRPITITLGTNFDIKVSETIEKRADTKHSLDATILYKVKNTSDESKSVEVIVPFNKQVKSSIKTNQKYLFRDGDDVVFRVDVKAQSTKSFKVRFRSKR